MVKLICPECHATHFTNREQVFYHAHFMHRAVADTTLGRERFWTKQHKVWPGLLKTNDANFAVADKLRGKQWAKFANDPHTRELPEDNIDHLHEHRAWLMEIDDDSEEEDGFDEDDTRGLEQKRLMDEWVARHRYGRSLRLNQTDKNRKLATTYQDCGGPVSAKHRLGKCFHSAEYLEALKNKRFDMQARLDAKTAREAREAQEAMEDMLMEGA